MEQNENRPLSGKVALITGASRGIGAAAAKRLARAGATVVINYLQRAELAQTVLHEIETAGGKGMTFQADVTEKEPVTAMTRAIEEKFGTVDVLVNNAYFPFEMKPLHELSWEALARATNHELAAIYHCTQAVLPGMSAKKYGKIIAVSTRLAQQPLPRMGAYAAAKAALESIAATMAIELGPLGITVNVVTPAFTMTEASAVMPEQFKERVRQNRPLQKHLYPEDVAGSIAFLASDEANMITGSNILITGGSHLQL
jgi:3-oxoacyl-[acyl-carrier protein] reductase